MLFIREVMSNSLQPYGLQCARLPCPSLSPAAVAAAKWLQLCPTLCDPETAAHQAPPSVQGKNTGVGCHCLLQCMKVKSLSRVRLLATPWTAAVSKICLNGESWNINVEWNVKFL